jgi:hypothetical protein
MAGYQPKVYREQGGDKMIVASGGTLAVESGGALTNAGTLTNDGVIVDNGVTYKAVTTQATTASVLTAAGTHLIGSTSAGALAYRLAKPTYAGQRKTLIVRNSTGALTVVASSAGATICKFKRTLTKITFGANSDNNAYDLIAETSTSWSPVGLTTGATTWKCT